MNKLIRLLQVTGLLLGITLPAFSQGDLAIHATFSRYSPAVYSIKVDIPKDVILQRYESSIMQLRKYQDSYAKFVENATEIASNYSLFENFITGVEQQISRLTTFAHMDHRVSGVGFAVGPHHMVTLSTVIKSATFGGDINIIDDFKKAHKAVVHGIDTMTGVAVLRIDDVTFPNYVNLEALSAPLPEASFVMSIQRPYDLPPSPSSGMIGGYYRRLPVPMFELERYIQSDLPLYPGNEGAPVFSPSGQLVGMIAGEFRVDNWPGITLLIPADMIIDSALDIIHKGKRERGGLPELTLAQHAEGILIQDVKPGSPSAKAGLVKGDIIIGLQGKEERNYTKFREKILNTRPNEFIQLLVIHGNHRRWKEVKTSPVK